jgi:site-specific DNA-methyltransferase (adenine-specific)
MTSEYIDACCREAARVLRPSGYLLQWVDDYRLGQAFHLRIADVLECVSICAWNSLRLGMGYRFRNQGDHLLALQKRPLRAKATWRDNGIPARWAEKADRNSHPHAKPAGLIARLIAAVTEPNDLIVDPAAGSFVVMHAARRLGRDFIGCDLAFHGANPSFDWGHVHDEQRRAQEPAAPQRLL